MKLFAGRLKESRKRVRMTQVELANQLHVSRDSIIRWERGHDVPSARMVVQIAIILDVTMAYLVGLSHRPMRATRSPLEADVLEVLRSLSPAGQQAALGMLRDLQGLERIGKGKNIPAKK